MILRVQFLKKRPEFRGAIAFKSQRMNECNAAHAMEQQMNAWNDDLVRSVSNRKLRIFGELSPSKVNDV